MSANSPTLRQRVAFRVNRLRGMLDRPQPPAQKATQPRLMFENWPGLEKQCIPADDPVHSELVKTLERCRAFPYDLAVFRLAEPETRFLPYLTDKAKPALDIGGNIGFYAALLSPLCLKVFSFEANPHLIPFLTVTMRHYPNVHVLPLAAAHRYGEARFNVPLGPDGDMLAHSGSGGMLGGFMDRMGIASVAVTVPTVAIDGFGFDDIGFMKIDVEGGEYGVLQGAAATIDRCRPAVVVENEYRHNPEDCGKVFDFMLSRGYNGYFLDRAADRLMPFSDFSLEANQTGLLDAQHTVSDPRRYVYNFMFAPAEADRLRPLLARQG